MMPSSEDVRVFLSRFRGTRFPHASEIVALLDGETAGVTVVFTTCELEKLRTTYRIRADLASRQFSVTFPPTPSTEVHALADAFDAADEQPVRMWCLRHPSGKVFVIFELVEAQRIAGAVASDD